MKTIKKKKWMTAMVLVVVFSLLFTLSGCSMLENHEQTENPLREVMLLYLADGYTVTATGMKTMDHGVAIGFEIDNQSDRDIRVITSELSVNGYMLPTSILYSEVDAGQTVKDTLVLTASDLAEAGIEAVVNIEFYLNLIDKNTGTVIYDDNLFCLEPTASADYVQPVDDSGDVIFDAKDMRVVSKGLRDDGPWNGDLVLYFENNLYRSVTVCIENISVNGIPVDKNMQVSLRAYTKCMDGLDVLAMEDLGITEISEISNMEFTLRVLDRYGREIVNNGVISLNFD